MPDNKVCPFCGKQPKVSACYGIPYAECETFNCVMQGNSTPLGKWNDRANGEAKILQSGETPKQQTHEAIKKAYIEGYSKGHNDTVESGDYCPEVSADDWLSEQHHA